MLLQHCKYLILNLWAYIHFHAGRHFSVSFKGASPHWALILRSAWKLPSLFMGNPAFEPTGLLSSVPRSVTPCHLQKLFSITRSKFFWFSLASFVSVLSNWLIISDRSTDWTFWKHSDCDADITWQRLSACYLHSWAALNEIPFFWLPW